MSQAFSDIDQQ